MNADARVAEHLPSTFSRAESDALFARIGTHVAEHGFGMWAVEAPGVAPFIGFVGLARPSFETAFTPCVEIAWRLSADHWGHGYATEAARGALAFGFDDLDLHEILTWTVPSNRRSLRVMEKLGMRRVPGGDFDHPRVPEGHALSRHVLYRIDRGEWTRRASAPLALMAATSPEQIQAVRALFREYERAIGVDLCFQGFADEIATLPGAYASPRGMLSIATVDTEPVGCVALRPLVGDGAELKRLYLRPGARGRGHGLRLVHHVMDGARERGYRRIRLDTLPSMTDAIALYRRIGFVEIPAYNENAMPGTLYFELVLSS